MAFHNIKNEKKNIRENFNNLKNNDVLKDTIYFLSTLFKLCEKNNETVDQYGIKIHKFDFLLSGSNNPTFHLSRTFWNTIALKDFGHLVDNALQKDKFKEYFSKINFFSISKILTFNYDNLIEKYLYEHRKNKSKKNKEFLYNLENNIHHFHGKIDEIGNYSYNNSLTNLDSGNKIYLNLDYNIKIVFIGFGFNKYNTNLISNFRIIFLNSRHEKIIIDPDFFIGALKSLLWVFKSSNPNMIINNKNDKLILESYPKEEKIIIKKISNNQSFVSTEIYWKKENKNDFKDKMKKLFNIKIIQKKWQDLTDDEWKIINKNI